MIVIEIGNDFYESVENHSQSLFGEETVNNEFQVNNKNILIPVLVLVNLEPREHPPTNCQGIHVTGQTVFFLTHNKYHHW